MALPRPTSRPADAPSRGLSVVREPDSDTAALAALLDGFSIEVMPRTLAKIGDLRPLLPAGSRVYLAHIDGTPIADMVVAARELAAQGFDVMPHFPARLIRDRAELAQWIARYQDAAGITRALVLAGGLSEPRGAFADSMQLLDTGLFEKAGFTRIHVAGHPEGNRDIDPEGGMKNVTQAILWKQDYARQTGIDMAIVTQFAFEAEPVITWADGLRDHGITLPVHLGVAGPARLQTMIRFAIACGVGPSLRVLQRRARDVRKLVMPHTPTGFVTAIARHRAAHPGCPITRLHLFPLGGIRPAAEWAQEHGAPPPARPG